MKFMILVKSNPDLEARLEAMSDSQMKDSMAAMEVFNEELRKAGILKDCDGLRLSREGFPWQASLMAVPSVTEDVLAGATARLPFAAVLAADPTAFGGYYHWDVYCKTTAGDVLLPVGYAETAPVSAAEYVAAHPQ